MKQRAAIIFSLVIVLSLGIQGTSYAQQGLNPPPPDSSRVGPTKGAMQDENGIWYMPEGSLPDDSNLVRSAPTPDGTTSSPDAYGYYWDDIVPYSWTDTSGGTDTGMSGSDDGTGPYSLPFSFKYYENTYTQVYISAYGYLTFTSPSYWSIQSPIPSTNTPNNVIAPLWGPSDIPAGAWVRYQTVGSSPNQKFVVEWHNITGGTDPDFADDIYIVFK